jgi:hypothetical protein
MFDGSLDGVGARCGGELETVANRVRDMMGVPKMDVPKQMGVPKR